MKIELNEHFTAAIAALNDTQDHIFVTGKAGTGKSILLQYFRLYSKKKLVVLAPTGIAAVNVKGQTIHSFFRLPPYLGPDQIRDHHAKHFNPRLKNILEKLDCIIIDEVSMVRADLMDTIDETLRYYLNNEEPFGGLQMIFIGDLYQLPPVVRREDLHKLTQIYQSPYFFHAKAFQHLRIRTLHLEKIYRQSDDIFIDLLAHIRENTAQEEHLEILNKRLDPYFDETLDLYITLTTTNAAADRINARRLSSLPKSEETYESELAGDFPQRNLPTQEELKLKKGAQIMMLTNDSHGRWVNGSVGKIKDIDYFAADGHDMLIIELDDGSEIEVGKHTWEMNRYILNDETQAPELKMVGSFTQYPLRLAWAVTIHKSQGKTFHKVVVDIGSGTFAHGQIYVALSRCTSLDGLVLRKPIHPRHIIMDRQITEFLEA